MNFVPPHIPPHRTAPPYRPTTRPTVRPTVRPHNFHSTILPYNSTPPYFFTFFQLFSKQKFKPHRTAPQISFHNTDPQLNPSVSFHDFRYRGTKIVGPYGGARKNVLKKLKLMTKYGGAVRWAILWGGTVGRYGGAVRNRKCLIII